MDRDLCFVERDKTTEPMKLKSYRELNVWSKGIEITNTVYDITLAFPADQRFGLAQQMQKAAVSISSNVAEGFMRQYTREYVQFCHIALVSCAELDTQLTIAKNRGYLNQSIFLKIQEIIDHECRMLSNLIKRFKEPEYAKRNPIPVGSEPLTTNP